MAGHEVKLAGQKLKVSGQKLKVAGHEVKMAGHEVKVSVEHTDMLGERMKLIKIPIHFPDWMLRMAGWVFPGLYGLGNRNLRSYYCTAFIRPAGNQVYELYIHRFGSEMNTGNVVQDG